MGGSRILKGGGSWVQKSNLLCQWGGGGGGGIVQRGGGGVFRVQGIHQCDIGDRLPK